MKWIARLPLLLLLVVLASTALGWGKKGHELVDQMAIRALPAELKPFYEKHAKEIIALAMKADEDKRKTGAEDIYHFIDLDAWGDPKHYPRSIDEGTKAHGFDPFLRAGLLPWRVKETFEELALAWKAKDVPKIIELSARIGHYAGDAHQPLHASANYDGQLTKNDFVHARYESDMLDSYDWEKAVEALLGQTKQVDDPFEATFEVALDSLSHVEEILKADTDATAKEPTLKAGPDGKLPRKRGDAYMKEMYAQLHVMTEQRLAKASTWAASLWWSAWVKAGKPSID